MDAQVTTGVEIDPLEINHPRHYNTHPSGVEVKEVTNHMNFNCGSAFKYVLRREEKGARDKDLRKALWYLDEQLSISQKDCTAFGYSAQRALYRMVTAEPDTRVKLFMICMFIFCVNGDRRELFEARTQVQDLLDRP